MLKSTLNKGFQLTFENGLTISVQFGYGSYCERRDYHKYDSVMQSDNMVESHDAEIAIWDQNEKWYDFGSDTVKGWCSADEVAAWITKTANAINIESITNEPQDEDLEDTTTQDTHEEAELECIKKLIELVSKLNRIKRLKSLGR